MKNGDDVANWLFDKDQINLDDGSDEPDRIEENEDVSLVDWETLFPGSRPKSSNKQGDYQQRLTDAPEDWHDTWKDPWVDELNENLIERVIGGISSSPDKKRIAEESKWDWDTAAWYQSIHFFGYDWGIFIKEDALIRQARYIGTFLPVTYLKNCIPSVILAKTLLRASLVSYFLHEQYHHKVECLGIRLYVVEKQPRYIPYWKQVYHPSLGKDELLEEALANASAYHRLSESPYSVWLPNDVKKSVKNALEDSFKIAPPGYRMAIKYLSKNSFETGENLLHGMVQEADLNPICIRDDWNFAPNLIQSIFKVNQGIWTVVPAGTRSILPTKATHGQVVYSRNEIVSFLKNIGYSIVDGGSKGSYIRLEKEGAKPILLPENRKTISLGVAKNIAKIIGFRKPSEIEVALKFPEIPIETFVKHN